MAADCRRAAHVPTPDAYDSTPAEVREKPIDLLGSAVWIFSMRKMADARKGREVKIGKGLFQPIGPRIRKEWVVFWPAYAS